MRLEVLAFISVGPLPDWNGTEEEIDRRGRQLCAISGPLTAEEASALAECFGPDDCYGLAWTLLHLIEAGPNPVLRGKPTADANEWYFRLWTRADNAGLYSTP